MLYLFFINDTASTNSYTYGHTLSLQDALPILSQEIQTVVQTEIKYEGYINRQITEVEKFKTIEAKLMPTSFDDSTVVGLGAEARQKLTNIRPDRKSTRLNSSH